MDILHKWCYFCSIKECVFGEHWLKEPVPFISNGKQFVLYGHRHDQSILSILRIGHKLPTVQKTRELYEFRNLGLAEKNNSLFYNHHGTFEYVQVLQSIFRVILLKFY